MTKPGLFKNILLAGLIGGTLDILAAIIILAKGNASGTFKYIAAGVFGKEAAYAGGAGMIACGFVFHFFIATCFAAGYFLAYPHVPLLQKNKWLSGIFYGAFIWAWMNFIILPFTQMPPAAFAWVGALRNFAILAVCVGIPVAWLADRFYKTRQE